MFPGGFPAGGLFGDAGPSGFPFGPPPGADTGSSKLYDLLGVNRDASQAEIKRSYRKLAVKAHPDKGGDAQLFKEINHAYEVLGNPELRKRYNAHGEAGLQPGGDPNDIFKMFFGGPHPQSSDGVAGRGTKDVLLPLSVTLEELFSGAVRRITVNRALLKREGHSLGRDTFEVRIDKGAPDGHWVTFYGQGSSTAGGPGPGDVSFVLQEKRHPRWRRSGLDLYTERTVTLLEALTGFRLVIEHLDGRRLVVQSRPGEIVRPRNLLPSAEAEWCRFDSTDAFAGEDAGSMRTGDIEACKEACRQRGYGGFTYWEDTAYFRAQSRESLLAKKRDSRGSTLFVCPDPAASAQLRMQRALRGEGMPCFENPMVRGNLFLLLRVEFPGVVNEEAAALLREALPPCVAAPVLEDASQELDLVDLDPMESQRQHHLSTGRYEVDAGLPPKDSDEAAPAGAPGPPPCRQM